MRGTCLREGYVFERDVPGSRVGSSDFVYFLVGLASELCYCMF